MENEIWFILYGLAGFYILLRILNHFSKKNNDYETELQQILNSDEYKVKSRYEWSMGKRSIDD